jgi:hypothetical protein
VGPRGRGAAAYGLTPAPLPCPSFHHPETAPTPWVRRDRRTLAPGFRGTARPRRRGPEVPRRRGPEVLQGRRASEPPACGTKVPRIVGTKAPGFGRTRSLWLQGSLAPKRSRTSDRRCRRPVAPENHRAMEPAHPGRHDPWLLGPDAPKRGGTEVPMGRGTSGLSTLKYQGSRAPTVRSAQGLGALRCRGTDDPLLPGAGAPGRDGAEVPKGVRTIAPRDFGTQDPGRRGAKGQGGQGAHRLRRRGSSGQAARGAGAPGNPGARALKFRGASSDIEWGRGVARENPGLVF